MFERVFERIDFLPGLKTIILAATVTSLFWGEKLGIVPSGVNEVVSPWLMGAMAPTVLARLIRK